MSAESKLFGFSNTTSDCLLTAALHQSATGVSANRTWQDLRFLTPLCFGLLIAGDTQRSAQPSSSHRTQTVIMAAFTVGMSGAYTPTRPVHRDASPPHRTSSGRHRPSESTKPCNIDIHFPDGERTHQPSIPRPIQQPPPPPGPSPSSPARDPSSSAPPSPSPAPPSAPRLRAPTSNPTTSPSSSRADRASPWTSSASSRTRARG